MDLKGMDGLNAMAGLCIGWCLSKGARQSLQSAGWLHVVESGECRWQRTRRAVKRYLPGNEVGSETLFLPAVLDEQYRFQHGWSKSWFYSGGRWFLTGDAYFHPRLTPEDCPTTAEKRAEIISRSFSTPESRLWAEARLEAELPARRFWMVMRWTRGIVEDDYPPDFPKPRFSPPPQPRLVPRQFSSPPRPSVPAAFGRYPTV